jgi:hypothetical protein
MRRCNISNTSRSLRGWLCARWQQQRKLTKAPKTETNKCIRKWFLVSKTVPFHQIQWPIQSQSAVTFMSVYIIYIPIRYRAILIKTYSSNCEETIFFNYVCIGIRHRMNRRVKLAKNYPGSDMATCGAPRQKEAATIGSCFHRTTKTQTSE